MSGSAFPRLLTLTFHLKRSATGMSVPGSRLQVRDVVVGDPFIVQLKSSPMVTIFYKIPRELSIQSIKKKGRLRNAMPPSTRSSSQPILTSMAHAVSH